MYINEDYKAAVGKRKFKVITVDELKKNFVSGL